MTPIEEDEFGPTVGTTEASRRLFALKKSRAAGKVVYGTNRQWVLSLIGQPDGLRAKRYPPIGDLKPNQQLFLVSVDSIEEYNRRQIAGFKEWLKRRDAGPSEDDPPLEHAS